MKFKRNKKYKKYEALIKIVCSLLLILILFPNMCKIVNNFLDTFLKHSIIFNYFRNKEIIKNKKVCLCTLGKEENRYIREYVQHYEKYGVDKIFLYDNNDINGEKFESVIGDYIEKGFVEIFNWRGKKKALFNIMNECYQKNFEHYDWLIFYELDEFIHLSNYSNIKIFLNEEKFNKCNLIYLNLLCHTDNNLLYYENKSLAERFPVISPLSKLGGRLLEIKCIMRGHIPGIYINRAHGCNYHKKYRNCNGFGHLYQHEHRFATERDYKYYYIDHYYSKSTEEFIDKLNKGDAMFRSRHYALHRISKYFSQSEFTEEKRLMIQNRTGLNLSSFINFSSI